MLKGRTEVRPRGILRGGERRGVMGLLILTLSVAGASPTSAGAWEPVGSLTQGRDGASATVLLDGSVLVAGGEGPLSGDPFSRLRTAERFDPRTNRFERTGPMGTVRFLHAALRLPDGRVLLLGGVNAGGAALATVEIFDPATGLFSPHGRLTTARGGPSATLLPDGRILVTGGAKELGGRRISTAELYDPATGTATLTGAMSSPRAEHAAVALADGKVAILGGTTERDSPGVRPVEIYDPATGTFAVRGEIAARGGRQSATLLADGRILIVGGVSHATPDAPETLGTAEIYDPGTGQSQPIASLSTPRYWHGAVALPQGGVLVLGGSLVFNDGPATKDVERIDPVSGAAMVVEPMAVPRARPGAVLLPDGRVLVFGGFPAWGVAPVTDAEIYRP
jgi:N-acetylneuraminic acid mutarotase